MLHEIEGVEREIRAREDLILAEMESAETLTAEVKREEAAFKVADEAAPDRGREMDEDEKRVQAESRAPRGRARRDREARPARTCSSSSTAWRACAASAVAEARDGMCQSLPREAAAADVRGPEAQRRDRCSAPPATASSTTSRRCRSSSPSSRDARERGRRPSSSTSTAPAAATRARPASASTSTTPDGAGRRALRLPGTRHQQRRRVPGAASTRCATRSRRAPPTSRVFSDSELVVKQIGGRVQGEAPGHACRCTARPARCMRRFAATRASRTSAASRTTTPTGSRTRRSTSAPRSWSRPLWTSALPWRRTGSCSPHARPATARSQRS